MADSREHVEARKERRTERSRSIGSRERSERSYDSDEERRRRRRRRDKEGREDVGRRERRDEDGGRERRGAKDDDRDAKRRRSRSPRGEESERKHRREREHRSNRDRDRDSKQRSRHSRSPRPRSRNRDKRPAEDDVVDRQVTRKSAGPLPSQAASFSLTTGGPGDVVLHDGQPLPEKQQPNFAPTGLLAAATKSVETGTGSVVVLKYHEPAEARKPAARDAWKLFVFKGAEIVDTIELGLRSCWLVGREMAVVDLPAEHPSISKQHAVVQFRYVEKRNEFGDKMGRVRPYLMDLESANGTRLNGDVVEGARYVELRDKDLVQFGDSTREYVVMLPPKD